MHVPDFPEIMFLPREIKYCAMYSITSTIPIEDV